MQTVEQLMTRSVITVSQETPVSDVARLLVEHGISGLPVVDADGRVVGIVSEGDVLLKEAGHTTAAPSRRPLARLFGFGGSSTPAAPDKLTAQTAGELMTSPALTISPLRTLRTAAEMMTSHRVNRLPVVDVDGRLLGIVSRADLVRAFVMTDEELVRTIRGELLHRIMWLDPDKFEVTAQHGAVKVSGQVIKRSTAETIERFLHSVPGVNSVELDLPWTEDDGGLTTIA